MDVRRVCRMVVGIALMGLALPRSVVAQAPATSDMPLPPYLQDRGPGVATSMFGTYIQRGELIVYPFFEYYRDRDLEYAPEELGASGADEYRGRHRASEGLVFVAYGLRDNLAVELEAAMIHASLEKAPDDRSALPGKITQSGIGDIEAQLRWRWRTETERGPEIFSFSEVVFPHHAEKGLIGTPGWELKFGTGLTRGFTWGTITGRAAIEYDEASSSHFDVGEYALEYLKRVSPRWRLYAGVEGTQDELSFITEAQWHLRPGMFIKIGNGFGLTSKATDWAPEVGVLFTLPVR